MQVTVRYGYSEMNLPIGVGQKGLPHTHEFNSINDIWSSLTILADNENHTTKLNEVKKG